MAPTRFAILTSFDGFEASERSVLNVRSARNGTWLPSVGRPNDASGSEANEQAFLRFLNRNCLVCF
ncbi:MAG: hypothetical protein ACTS46_01930 [Candidatus Hodgkinia cicadicola]